MEEEVNVRVEFKGEMAEKFNKVKDELGVKNNTEVVRILINRKFSEMFKSKKGPEEKSK